MTQVQASRSTHLAESIDKVPLGFAALSISTLQKRIGSFNRYKSAYNPNFKNIFRLIVHTLCNNSQFASENIYIKDSN